MATGKSGVRNHKPWARQIPRCGHRWADGAGVGGHGRGCSWWQIPCGCRNREEDEGWKGSILQDCARLCVQQRSRSTTTPGMGPTAFHGFSLLFHFPSTTSSISCVFSGCSEVRESGKSAGERRGGDAGGTAVSQVLLGQEHPFHGT